MEAASGPDAASAYSDRIVQLRTMEIKSDQADHR